jgi:transcriptional regulator with XRE-family HTH domain
MAVDRPGTRGPSGMDPSLPLAELVSDQRARLSLSLGGVARRMHQAAEQKGNRHCGATRQTIHQIERGRIPHPDALRWLAAALELPLGQVTAAAREQRMNRRQLLQATGALGLALWSPDETGRLTRSRAVQRLSAREVVGYLGRVFPEFSTADWLLGSQVVLPTIPRHLATIQQLLAEATGTDRVEVLGVAARWAEFAAWLYQDAGHGQAGAGWASRALAWAEEADDQVMVAYTLARQADLAADRQDAAATVGLAQAALRRSVPARVRAVALQEQASGHALAGEEAAAFRALDRAREEAARGDEGPGRYCTPGYVEMQRAACWLRFGHFDQAIGAFERELAQLPAVHRRDRGRYLARLSSAYAATGDQAEASATAAEARQIARATGSKRILSLLAR